MKAKQKIGNMAFCCPTHGAIKGNVEYFSADYEEMRFVDIPVKYCPKCQNYYSPYSNLWESLDFKYKGKQVLDTQTPVSKTFPREIVRIPYWIDIKDPFKVVEQKEEKHKQYIEGIQEVRHDRLMLTNKVCLIKDNKCPCCSRKLKKQSVKITQYRKYLFAKIWSCIDCGHDFITPEQIYSLCTKAKAKFRRYNYPFVIPMNVQCEHQEIDSKLMFIPRWAINTSEFDCCHLPPTGDSLYEMTDDEYCWVKTYYDEAKKKAEAAAQRAENAKRVREVCRKCNVPDKFINSLLYVPYEEVCIRIDNIKYYSQRYPSLGISLERDIMCDSKELKHWINKQIG